MRINYVKHKNTGPPAKHSMKVYRVVYPKTDKLDKAVILHSLLQNIYLD